jgi:competence protein ComEC
MLSVWAALPGAVLGVALQLLQVRLWPVAAHLGMLGGAVVLAAVALRWRGRSPLRSAALGLMVGALAAAGVTGLRAAHFLEQRLQPGLEGRDIVVIGQIASMPQRSAESDRFEFAVTSAALGDRAVRLPPRLLISDFRGSGAGRAWRAGDGWRLTVRLRRPHGLSDPHGFDRERWLWEHGIGATGYLRDAPRDAAPVSLGLQGAHPVEAARQWVSERIVARVPDVRSAGVPAALVVGDQSAIDRADWAL